MFAAILGDDKYFVMGEKCRKPCIFTHRMIFTHRVTVNFFNDFFLGLVAYMDNCSLAKIVRGQF